MATGFFFFFLKKKTMATEEPSRPLLDSPSRHQGGKVSP